MIHYRLKSGKKAAEGDKTALEGWLMGNITTTLAIRLIRSNNENEDMFKTENEFYDWAKSLGYVKRKPWEKVRR